MGYHSRLIHTSYYAIFAYKIQYKNENQVPNAPPRFSAHPYSTSTQTRATQNGHITCSVEMGWML